MSQDSKVAAATNPFAMTREIVNSMFPIDSSRAF